MAWQIEIAFNFFTGYFEEGVYIDEPKSIGKPFKAEQIPLVFMLYHMDPRALYARTCMHTQMHPHTRLHAHMHNHLNMYQLS